MCFIGKGCGGQALTFCPSTAMAEAPSQPDPDLTESTSPETDTQNVMQAPKPKRLAFTGKDGLPRRIRLLNSCLPFKAALFGPAGKRKEIYEMVSDDLNKYCPELFHGMLKTQTVSEQWNKALKDAVEQDDDMRKNHALWYNGSVLREMSPLEKTLSEIFTEKKLADAKREAEKRAEEEEERDAEERAQTALDRVQERYDAGQVVGSSDTDVKESGGEDGAQVETPTYGRGTKKGSEKVAKGNKGLSPDPKADKLVQSCQAQERVAESLVALADRLNNDKAGPKRSAEDMEIERGNLKVSKMHAAVAVSAMVLEYQRAGFPVPARLLRMLEDDDD